MKRLTLIRHGKSSWKDSALADFERPLNQRGMRDAPRMGQRLASRGLVPDFILSSPARRAHQTATALAERLELSEPQLGYQSSIYQAEPATLLALIRGFDDKWRHVMIVGHNPGLTDLGNLLADGAIDNLPTCGLLVIEFAVDRWTEVAPRGGILTLFDFPKNPAT